MTYFIQQLPEAAELPLNSNTEFFPEELPDSWKQLEIASIHYFPWDQTGYKPMSEARLGWNRKGLFVLMYSNEKEIRCEETEIGGGIYKDSCLELYIGKEDTSFYFNFESNAAGVMFIGCGTDRTNRKVLKAYPEGMEIKTAKHNGKWWAVSYFIPVDFFAQWGITGWEKGLTLKGNFYKCGDFSVAKHHGMWSPIDWFKPDFHRPEFFSEMKLL